MDIVSSSEDDDAIAWYENDGAADPSWTAADIATSADQATSVFVGKHDFNAFRSIDCQSSSSIKTIQGCSIKTNDQHVIVNVSAKSFLHSQVRIMAGTLVEVGKGKFNSSDVRDIIKSRDRSQAGATAPAHGLYLLKVEY